MPSQAGARVLRTGIEKTYSLLSEANVKYETEKQLIKLKTNGNTSVNNGAKTVTNGVRL